MRQTNPITSDRWGWAAWLLLGLVACGAQACVEEEEPVEAAPWEDPAYQLRTQDLSSMCRVNVGSKGWIDTETDYIPHVIACENGNAPLEALKAQAIAARTFAKFKMDVERVAVPDSQAGQVYSCGREPSAIHFQAARETAGQVVTHNGQITAAFYVSGVMPSTSSCVPSSQDKARASATDRSMENRVTYNAGRQGSNVKPAQPPMGHPGNPANRGVMSQNGSTCLSNAGRPAAGILRFYYGDDIRVTDLEGSCGEDVGDGPTTEEPSDPNANDAASCRETDSAPAYVTRAQWSARNPTSNSGSHTPNKITIHHAAGPNSVVGGAGIKSIQNYHIDTKGWSDIGYHYLIDQDGTIYQGRPENKIGAHVLNQNTGNLGICLIGNFDTAQVPDAQFKAAAHLVKHLSTKYNIALNRTNIKGHGERMSTECPGSNLRSKLDQLVQMSGADILCEDADEDASNDTPYEYEGPEVTIEGTGYKFLRYSNHAEASAPMELDSVYLYQAGKYLPVKAVKSSSNTTNAEAALGLPDVSSCGDRTSKIATINVGGNIVFELPSQYETAEYIAFNPGLGGFNGLPDVDEDKCPASVGSYGVVEYSRDGMTWFTHDTGGGLSPPSTIGRRGAYVKIVAPDATQIPRQVRFESQASEDVVRVEYYAEQWRLGQGTGREAQFPLDYRFNGVGQRLVTAVAYDALNKPVARDEQYFTVGDGISFITPKDKGTYGPDLVFQVAAGEDVAKVEYYADGTNPIGSSTNKSGNFRVEKKLTEEGERKIKAKAYDSSGKLIDEVEITITVKAGEDNFRFAYPNNGGSYKPTVRFLMEVSRPDITRVVYKANPDVTIGESSNRANQFEASRTFSERGRRTITAQGFNAQGQKVAEASIQILITDENGAVPGGSTNDPPPNTDPNPGTNTASANDLATEAAKRYSPTYGTSTRSQGRCWHYVKQALYRWEISSSEYSALRGAGPCSAYNFDMSAYCGGRNAAANPQTLKSKWGMTKINVAPNQAPRGALIFWDRGCSGYNATHGHVEVAQGDGTACSDYCGRLKAGNPSCASVFIPSN